MRKARRSDKDKVVEIIIATFENNPGVNWMLNPKGNRKKQIKRLASFAFIKAFLRDGVFISSNEKGVALCYKFNERVFSFTEMFYELRFALLSMKLSHIPKVLKRESVRKNIRPVSGEYLYFWFLGVLPDGAGAALELRETVFAEARNRNIPIYLETAMERNKLAYERKGFETYHYWNDEKENIRFWFMRWEPEVQ